MAEQKNLCYNCFQEREAPEGPCPYCGFDLAENEKKHLNRPWEQVEPSAHAAWELYNRDSEQSWEKNRDAIKFGWDYVMEGHKPGKSFL